MLPWASCKVRPDKIMVSQCLVKRTEVGKPQHLLLVAQNCPPNPMLSEGTSVTWSYKVRAQPNTLILIWKLERDKLERKHENLGAEETEELG